MKWRRDTCLFRSLPPSLTLSSWGCRFSRRGCVEGSLRCRQFWSNICPRKNKSPLSLTTGRASLVSNRALLNRRRITDPKEPASIQATHRSFHSLNLSSVVVSNSTDFLFFTGNRTTSQASPRLTSGVFIENFIGFLPSLFRSLLSFAFDCQRRSRTNAIKISRSYEECGTSPRRNCLVRTRVSRHRDFANLSRFLLPSFFRWKTRSCR